MISAADTDPKRTLYLVDISSFIFRAFFAIRSLRNRAGEPTNAIYGVATMLAKLIDDAKPKYMAVAYDSKEKSFRKEKYPEYKANRSAPPEDLVPQFERIDELVKVMGIPAFRKGGVEADDLIGSMTREWCEASPDHQVVIVTGDKDLMQMVSSRVTVWDTMANKVYGEKEVEEKLGVRPGQVIDFLGLVGDSSDNIPGVPGVGPKTAVELLKKYENVAGVVAAAKKGAIPGKRGETIASHESDALLSADLATVHQKLNLGLGEKEFSFDFKLGDDAYDFLRRMSFDSLVERWKKFGPGSGPVSKDDLKRPVQNGLIQAPPPPAAKPVATADAGAILEPTTVGTEELFQKVLKELRAAPEFAIDLETTSLNPREAVIVGIAVCADDKRSYYIPLGHRGTSAPQLDTTRVLEGLKPLIEDPRHKKIGQNLKYDWSVLLAHGLKPDGVGADTMVASYVLDPEGRHNLDTLSAKYLDYKVLTYEDVCGKGKDQLPFDLVPVDVATRYSAEDAWVAMRLWRAFQPALAGEKLMQVFAEVDLPLVEVLAEMEMAGVCIDVDWLAKLGSEFRADLRRIQERVEAYTDGPINLNSPRQLGELLFNKLNLPTQGRTKTGFSTDASVLDALSPLHEVPRLLLESREVSKLLGTYVDPLPGLRDPKTGKIHAGFHQTVAATGRLSSSDPNLQNIPVRSERGRKIRRAFVPCPGNVFVAADYSQIELRLLAHMSGDAELIRSFRANEDVHRRTASEIFGIQPDAVDDRQRGIAKAINFGLMYGKTPFGLAQELKIPRREAQEIIEKYFTRYSGVKRFLDSLITGAKEQGFTTTLLGRKRALPDLHSRNPAIRANAERMAMNTPIQGTASDLMKLAMIELSHELKRKGLESKLIIQVHDEMVLDCPVREAEAVKGLLERVMEGAMTLSVPLSVNSGTGRNWLEIS